MIRSFFLLSLFLLSVIPAAGQQLLIEESMRHLRVGDVPEWAAFDRQPDGERLEVRFTATPNEGVQTLRLQQHDVKLGWWVVLNGERLGQLIQDEKEMVLYWPVPSGLLTEGENVLVVEPETNFPDDIRVGNISLLAGSPDEVRAEATVNVTVTGAETGRPLPARITVVDEGGALHQFGAESNDSLAVRQGVVYTGTGRASFGLPAGTYTVYAGRGFEYGLDSTKITLGRGEDVTLGLTIRREVPTEGYVATDTHMHTLTHGGHGDATMNERMLTLAGEGIELAVSTEHNKFIEFETAARDAGVRSYFTPVTGDEVTTRVGHFNIFPIAPEATVPDPEASDWPALFEDIYGTPGVTAVILNHGRDVHSGFRPFDPSHFRAVAGEYVDGRVLRANGMEIINSGATMTDGKRLLNDWFGLLNRGYRIAPVGGSDAHDVIRYIVGQGRTYIRAQDEDPGEIDVDEAVQNFVEGRVMVSFGLMAEITVDGSYGPGDLVPANDSLAISVRVLGPGWTKADRVVLYANGHKIREAEITGGDRPGVKWEGAWRLPRPAHDVFLVAVAEGPGIDAPYWRIEKPYQPTTTAWASYVTGASGAVRVDADEDGEYSSAYEYAEALVEAAGDDVPALVRQLSGYDEAVAIQAASVLAAGGLTPADSRVQAALAEASPQARRGFEAYLEAWQQSTSTE